jgi:excisionase family DNA binding protein
VVGSESTEFYTLSEVAKLLRVSERTMFRATSPEAGKDRLLAVRIGRTTRVRRSVLTAWLKARES